MPNEYQAQDLVKLIRLKYPERSQNGLYNTNVVLEEVADDVGHSVRWIDAAVFSMWRSHGLTRSAFEVKVSRSDFLRELKKPDKYEWCIECFHEFWYVAPKGVIQVEELPVGAGWLYPRGKQLVTGRQAARNPNPRLDDGLLASFMRSAWKEINRCNQEDYEEKMFKDTRYQTAQIFQEGTERFFKERGLFPFIHDSDEVFNTLQNATLERQFREDRNHFLSITGEFQRKMMELLNLFIVIATKSLFLRNDTGRYIVNSYGGIDDSSIEALKNVLKPKGRHIQVYHDKQRKQFAKFVKLLLEGGIFDADT